MGLPGGRREDSRNLFDEYEAAGYTVVTSAAEMEEAMSGQTPEKLLGLFSSSHMNVWLDRNVYTDNLGDFVSGGCALRFFSHPKRSSPSNFHIRT